MKAGDLLKMLQQEADEQRKQKRRQNVSGLHKWVPKHQEQLMWFFFFSPLQCGGYAYISKDAFCEIFFFLFTFSVWLFLFCFFYPKLYPTFRAKGFILIGPLSGTFSCWMGKIIILAWLMLMVMWSHFLQSQTVRGQR